jgi:hypothetical protein
MSRSYTCSPPKRLQGVERDCFTYFSFHGYLRLSAIRSETEPGGLVTSSVLYYLLTCAGRETLLKIKLTVRTYYGHACTEAGVGVTLRELRCYKVTDCVI